MRDTCNIKNLKAMSCVVLIKDNKMTKSHTQLRKRSASESRTSVNLISLSGHRLGLLFIPLRMYSQATRRELRGAACEYIRRGMKSRPIETDDNAGVIQSQWDTDICRNPGLLNTEAVSPMFHNLHKVSDRFIFSILSLPSIAMQCQTKMALIYCKKVCKLASSTSRLYP